LLFRVFPAERSLALTASLFALLTLCLGVMLRSAQTALFLDNFDPSWLPYHYAAVALCMMGVSIFYAKISQGRTWRLDLACLFIAALLLLGCRLALLWVPSKALVFLIAVLALLVSQFSMLICFTSINISLDSRQTKRILPLVGAGATLGSMLGGVLVAFVAGHWQNDALFAVAGLWLLVLAFLPLLLHRLSPSEARKQGGITKSPTFAQAVGEGLNTVLKSSYLRNIAIVVALCGASQLCIDFLFKVTLKSTFEKEAMSEFLGLYYIVFNSLMLLSQLFVVGRVASVFRLGTLAALSPAAILVGAVICGVVFASGMRPFLAYVGLELLADLFVLTLFSQSRDAAYAPIGQSFRRQANVLIRGVIKPATTLGGSILILALARLPSWALLIPIAVFALLWLWRARIMGQLYFLQVRKALKRRQLLTDANTNAAMTMDGQTLRHLREELPRLQGQGLRFTLELLAENGYGLDYCRGLLKAPGLEKRILGFTVLAENFPEEQRQLLAYLQATNEPALLRQGISLLNAIPIEPLRAWAEHPDPWVRAEVWALDRFVPPEFNWQPPAPLGLSREFRQAAAYALGFRQEQEALLLALLVDADLGVRKEAIASSGRRRLLPALPFLIDALKQPELSAAAVESLAAYGEGALDVLSSGLNETGETVQRGIISALARIDHPQAEAVLIDRLQAEKDLGQFDRLLRALLRGGKRKEACGGRVGHDLVEREILRALILRICCERIRDDTAASDSLGAILLHEGNFQQERCWSRIFALLELSYGHGETVRNARLSWQSSDGRLRSFALEALNALVDAGHRDLLIPLMEGGGKHTGLIEELDHDQLKAELQLDTIILFSRWGGKWLTGLAGPGVYQDTGAALNHEELQSRILAALGSGIDGLASLSAVGLFGSLSAFALQKLVRISEEKHFSTGSRVCEQGEEGEHLYSIYRGNASIWVDEKQVNEVGPGSAVGEIALLDGCPRTATVVATTDIDVLRISRQNFLQLVAQEPGVARGVISGLIGHIRRQS
jgi:HEAT repeat protein